MRHDGQGEDFSAIVGIPQVDIGSVHIYLEGYPICTECAPPLPSVLPPAHHSQGCLERDTVCSFWGDAQALALQWGTACPCRATAGAAAMLM